MGSWRLAQCEPKPRQLIGWHSGHLEAAAQDEPRHAQRYVQVGEKRRVKSNPLEPDALECGCSALTGASRIEIDEPSRASVLCFVAQLDCGLEPVGDGSAFRSGSKRLASHDRMVKRLYEPASQVSRLVLRSARSDTGGHTCSGLAGSSLAFTKALRFDSVNFACSRSSVLAVNGNASSLHSPYFRAPNTSAFSIP